MSFLFILCNVPCSIAIYLLINIYSSFPDFMVQYLLRVNVLHILLCKYFTYMFPFLYLKSMFSYIIKIGVSTGLSSVVSFMQQLLQINRGFSRRSSSDM